MGSTKAPSGLSVARDTMKYTLSWKIADEDYGGGQEFQYRTNLDESGAWTSVSIGNAVTSRTISFTASDYYPTTANELLRIAFRVRGKRASVTEDNVTTTFDWSAWTTKVYELHEPKRPTLAEELDDEVTNKTEFTWETEYSTEDSRPAVNVEWQAVLIHNCTETDGSKISWSSSQSTYDSGTGSLSDSITKTEDSDVLASGSYTRWVRVRSRGCAGASEWRYIKHVYARPYAAEIRDVGSVEESSNTTVRVEWASQQDAAHPIDRSGVEYTVVTPGNNLACPSGASWTEVSVVADTLGTDAVRVVVPAQVGEDTCMYVRVVNYHDRNVIPSDPQLVRSGYLKAPTGLTVTNIDSTNYQVDIACTNNSTVPDSKLAVIYRRDGKSVTCGIIGSTGTITDLQCPAWSDSSKVGFSVYAFQGTYTSRLRDDGVTVYTINENMSSSRIGYNVDIPSIPKAPASVSLTAAKNLTEVVVSWAWSWTDADTAEISWSDDKHAWRSTNQPQTYAIDTGVVTSWRVSGLTIGRTYYFRVRLGMNGEEFVWSPYSETVEIGLYSVPATPDLQLSAATVQQGGKFTASWTYSSADGIGQESAEVCAYANTGVIPLEANWPKMVVARAKSGQAANVSTEGWVKGTSYTCRVRVTSKAGLVSAWSDPVQITIPADLSITAAVASFTDKTITDSSGVSRTVRSLVELPFAISVSPGAPNGGTTTAIMSRNETYSMIRPDSTTKEITGYDGEVVAIKKVSGNGSIQIRKKDLIGSLDDGAKYMLTVIAEADPATPARLELPFEVHWNTQAIIPARATIVWLTGNAVKITPTTLSISEGATCDIYRLSADKPELIIQDGRFNTAYVDPFPAIGVTGGYRVVYKTANGDYITAGNKPAWMDTPAGLETEENIIDFAGEQISLKFNMAVSHSWVKDFTETKYLGGAVQGDWNLGTRRTTSITATSVVVRDQTTIDALRRLAIYTGICHVRTVDGSSFACDIQVAETRSYKTAGNTAEFDLKITRVDPEALDGVKYSEWINS